MTSIRTSRYICGTGTTGTGTFGTTGTKRKADAEAEAQPHKKSKTDASGAELDERFPVKCVCCNAQLPVEEAQEAYDNGWVRDNEFWECADCYNSCTDAKLIDDEVVPATPDAALEAPPKAPKAPETPETPEAPEAAPKAPEAAPKGDEVVRVKLQGHSYDYDGNGIWSRDKEQRIRLSDDSLMFQGNDIITTVYACSVRVYFRCSAYQDTVHNDCSDLRLLFSRYGTKNHRLAQLFANHINSLFQGVFKVEIVPV